MRKHRHVCSMILRTKITKHCMAQSRMCAYFILIVTLYSFTSFTSFSAHLFFLFMGSHTTHFAGIWNPLRI